MKEIIVREKCPVCNGNNKVKIFERDYKGCSSIAPFSFYTVYQCLNCGMIYAGDAYESMPLDEYYDKMSKYEGDNVIKSSEVEYANRREAEFIANYVDNNSSIIDIGCAYGGLLHELQKRGFNSVEGLELSEKNIEYAKTYYDIHVYHGGLGYEVPKDKKFDLIILSCTLEHILDIQTSIREMVDMLTDCGKIFISVPLAENFASHKDLYQEFSIEHINYFTRSGLNYLMAQFDLRLVTSQIDKYESAGLAGIVYTLWEKGDTDMITPNCNLLDSYMDICDEYASTIRKELSHKDYSDGFYIWCAGTMTAMLYQLNFFPKDAVLGIVDSNINLQGMEIYGHKILSPEHLKTLKNAPILIASQQAKESILIDISKIGLKNKVWIIA